ncbi:MAG: NADPH-dependent FMN reductase [Bacteroidia bacterium]
MKNNLKIVAFGASYSSTSINRQFAGYAAGLFENAEVELLDLREFDLPLFTSDREKELGKPEAAQRFIEKLKQADLLIISMGEHNGSYEAAFKNLFDWTSRIELKMFEGKKILLLSTSPGGRGGLGALETAKTRFPIHGAVITAHFSLPRFRDNFSAEQGIVNEELKNLFLMAVEQTKSAFQ